MKGGSFNIARRLYVPPNSRYSEPSIAGCRELAKARSKLKLKSVTFYQLSDEEVGVKKGSPACVFLLSCSPT